MGTRILSIGFLSCATARYRCWLVWQASEVSVGCRVNHGIQTMYEFAHDVGESAPLAGDRQRLCHLFVQAFARLHDIVLQLSSCILQEGWSALYTLGRTS